MRILKTFIFLILILTGVVLAYKTNLDIKKEQNRRAITQEVVDPEQYKIKNRVDAEAIIKKALKAVGVISVLEGSEQYKQVIEDETWFSYRGVNIDWYYRFSIATSLEDVIIEVKDGVVNCYIDDSKMFIWFVEKTKESNSHSEASWLAKKYSSHELDVLEKAVMEKVENKIKSTPNYWTEARKSLEENITKICNQLGYYQINFVKDSSPD